jgi:hypothetical protein
MLISACRSTSASPAADFQAQVTQTMQALATSVQATLQAAVPTAALPTSTPLPTETQAPTQTPAATDTPVPENTATTQPTASAPTARINIDTNCRSGPGTLYSIIFTALKDSDVKIVSNTTVSDYVIAENPANPGQSCWLWTRYVTINGNLSSLPVTNPPPTPTPSLRFTITYFRIEDCTDWSVAFKVVNTGSRTLQSYKIVAVDLNENTQETTTKNHFSGREACSETENIASLDTNKSGFIYADDFPFDPTGDAMKATITVCSSDDLEGVCQTQVFNFTP